MTLLKEKWTLSDTAMSAANAKWSASSKGYYSDKYIESFLDLKHPQLPHQNLGCTMRVFAISSAVKQFFAQYGKNSIVIVLGCGYDTLFFRLQDQSISFDYWVEIDTEEVISYKRSIISKSLFHKRENIPNYYLKECDLQDFSKLISIFNEFNLSSNSLPVLFIDEFSLIYINENSYINIMKYVASISQSAFIGYTMTLSEDDFGKLISHGFSEIGIPLQSYQCTSTKKKTIEKMISFGLKNVSAIQCDEGLYTIFSPEELSRFMTLEIINDTRELNYVLKHYLIYYAGNCFKNLFPKKMVS